MYFLWLFKIRQTWILNIVYCNLRQMKIQSFLFKYLKGKKLYSMFFHWIRPDCFWRMTVTEHRSAEAENKWTVDADRTDLLNSDIDNNEWQ